MKKVLLTIVLIIGIMLGEFQYIMTHLDIERGNGGTMYVSALGCTETYHVEGWQEYAYADYLTNGTTMTVDDVVSRVGCDYFIVKEVDTLAVLNEDVYMDREVVEINICDDTEDTLCLFIDLNDNEPQRVRKA